MNVGALTSAVKAQPIKAIFLIALTAKVAQIAWSQLKAISPKDCFTTVSNWTQKQFIVKQPTSTTVAPGGESVEVEMGICWSKTVIRSAFSTAALVGAGFLAQFAFNQIRG